MDITKMLQRCGDKNIVNMDIIKNPDRDITNIIFDCYNNLKNAILVACGKEDAEAEGTTLRLTQLQFAGSKPVTAEQVCHGSQLDDGDTFVTAPE